MSSGFYFPTKAGATAVWVPSRQPVFPATGSIDFPEQLTGETAGGTIYVQDKGPKRENFELRFVRIPKSDRDGAHTFFDTVKKAFQIFEYEDPSGARHTVRWINEFDFRQVLEGRYSGTIALRKETA